MPFVESSAIGPQPLTPSWVSAGTTIVPQTPSPLFPELILDGSRASVPPAIADPPPAMDPGNASQTLITPDPTLPPPPDSPVGGIRAIGSSIIPISTILDTAGNSYTIGYFTGIVDVDPSDRIFALSSQGGSDFYITKFDATGNLLWARSGGGLQNDRASDIVLDEQGNLHIVGIFSGSVDFDPGDREFRLTSPGREDVFALTLDKDGNFVNALANRQQGVDLALPILTADIALADRGGSLRVGIVQGAVPTSFPLENPGTWVPVLEDTNDDGTPDRVRVGCGCQPSIPVRQYTWTIDAQTANALAQSTHQVATIADFNQDGQPDLLMRHLRSGENNVWLMNRQGLKIEFTNTLADDHWRVAAGDDFNRDGKVDLIWRNYETGENRLWWMNGTAVNSVDVLPTLAGGDWAIVTSADFNQDGHLDLLWRDRTSGQALIWLMHQSLVRSMVSVAAGAGADWTLVDNRDRTQDGQPDLLWQNPHQNQEMLWQMDGPQVRNITTRTLAPASYAGLNWDHLPKSFQLLLAVVISLLFMNQRHLDVIQADS